MTEPLTPSLPGHQARKRFGQNFLRDSNIIDRILKSVAPTENDRLLEIGPGQAALTDLLAASGAQLDCVELDRDLAEFLRGRFADKNKVTIHQQDILKFDLNELSPPVEDASLRVIGNLPYNISTPVLFHLLRSHRLIRDMVFMLQLEVVERMAAQAGDKNYCRLGVMLQYYCTVEHLFNVPPEAFSPRPKVSSAIVRLRPHQSLPYQAKDSEILELVVRTAFNQRRKTLKNSMKNIMSLEAMEQTGIDFSLRPEKLTLAEYVRLSDAVAEDVQKKEQSKEQ